MKKIINFRPIIFLAVSLCMGILSAYSFTLGKIVLGVISLLALLGCVALLWVFWRGFYNDSLIEEKSPIKSKIIFTVVALILAGIGALNFCLTVKNYDDANLGNRNYEVTAYITEISPTEYGSACVLDRVVVKGHKNGGVSYKITLYVTGEHSLDIGDNIRFNALLTDRDKVYENEFSAHYVAEGIKYTATVDAADVTRLSRDRSAFETVHTFIRDSLKAGLGEKEFSVAYGLLCGNADYMDGEVISNFRASGVAHIFAVSGLHIGFCAVVLKFLTDKLKFNKYVKFVFILSVLIFYSGVCGFTASSIRATVMTGVLLFAELLGKKYDSLSSIGVAGIGILLFSPIQLFCVGFQLSFGVVIGICVLSKPISKLLKFLPKRIADSLGVVLSAQIFGIPISIAAFGEFSLIAIIANFIFIPLVGAIYVITFLCAIIGGIFGAQTIALFVPNYILKFIITLITAFDYTVFMVGGFTFAGSTTLYYLAFLIWSDKVNFKLIYRAIISAVLALTLTVWVVLANVTDNKAVKLTAINATGACMTVIDSKGETTLVVNSSNAIFSTNRLNRALKNYNAQNIDALIVANAVNKNDVQIIMTKLLDVLPVRSVYYFEADGENDSMQKILNASFVNVTFTPAPDGGLVSFDNYSVAFALNGYCAKVNAKTKTAYLFSPFGEYSAGYGGLKLNPNLIIATDYVDQIYAMYKPNDIVSYTQSVYSNAVTQGNYIIKI